MRAARMHGNKDLRVDDVPRLELSPGKALVEVQWCGICGSDLHEYLEGVPVHSSLPILSSITVYSSIPFVKYQFRP